MFSTQRVPGKILRWTQVAAKKSSSTFLYRYSTISAWPLLTWNLSGISAQFPCSWINFWSENKPVKCDTSIESKGYFSAVLNGAVWNFYEREERVRTKNERFVVGWPLECFIVRLTRAVVTPEGMDRWHRLEFSAWSLLTVVFATVLSSAGRTICWSDNECITLCN